MAWLVLLTLLPAQGPAQPSEVEVRIDGKVLRLRADDELVKKLRALGIASEAPARKETPPQTVPVASRDEEPPGGQSPVLLGLLAVLGLGLLAMVLYVFVLAPRVRERPLRQALDILARDELPAFPAAEQLLALAITAGLRARRVAEARFALAYVRSRLGSLPQALAALDDLDRTTPPTADSAYLRLWLHARLGQHEQAERTFAEHRVLLLDYLDAKTVVGVSYLRLALVHWSRKEAVEAIRYFALLRELGVLTEEVPEQVDDHHVVLGVSALFERNLAEARRHFEGAVKAAEQADKPAVRGKLGLLLCAWREASRPDVDDELGRVARALGAVPATDAKEMAGTTCRHCQHSFRVPRRYEGQQVACGACRRKFVVALAEGAVSSKAPEPRLLNEEDLLRRNVRLWYTVSRLFAWWNLPAKGGLPAPERQAFGRRLGWVLEADPEMPDADLLAGLIAYYFAVDLSNRQPAVERLRQATKRGVNLPEVLHLLDREDRLAALRKDSVKRFLALARSLLLNAGVPLDTRKRLQKILKRFPGARELLGMELPAGAGEAAKIHRELEGRVEQTRRRAEGLAKSGRFGKLPDKGVPIDQLVKQAEEKAKGLAKHAEGLEATEAELILWLAQYLLPEEEPPPPKPAPAASGPTSAVPLRVSQRIPSEKERG